ncbi:hypothetical protein B4589_001050 [Halolamina sp. CBA1230]|uniref:hypothetical protein n=1 Tax=Halolamina sp. CBA1230 TaxID=1853690 RepID=UPI0009A19F0C|nr:hypothetical protein [Halolamina sp. CBA1230]QKY19026.1 hypothetical protein B4589_001050 [Halolamina sp. CBA1230]
MVNRDSGWRPDGAMDAFGGYEIWEYNVGPHEVNVGEVDGSIDFEKYEGEDEFPTSVDELDDDDE